MRAGLAALLLLLGGAATARAEGDTAAGERVFSQCRACHQVGEKATNQVGPTLNGLFGRRAGAVPGFSYSAANKDSGVVWDEAVFSEYIRDPKARIPGTKMVYPGLKNDKQVADLTAYLRQFAADGTLKP